jgi:hypothetical protein
VPLRRPLLALVALTAGLVQAHTALADEPSRLANPLGLRAREEVFVAPPPPRAVPQARTAAASPAAPTAQRETRQRENAQGASERRVSAQRETAQRPDVSRENTPVETTQRTDASRGHTPRETARPEATTRAPTPRETTRAETSRPRAPTRRPRRPAPPCLSPPTELVRVDGPRRESKKVSLTFCDGRPRTEALEALSVIARPHRVEAPEASTIRAYARRVARRPRRGETRPDPNFVAEGVRRLDPGLVPRVARIAAHFPGKAIEIVSGWRPNERPSSRHHQARAVDVRVRGVSRETLRDFARTLEETGVGYYPNSVFVHVDVREARAYWVDRSGPGEEADYGTWPPTNEERRRVEERVVASALATLERLREDTTADESGGAHVSSPTTATPDANVDDTPSADSNTGTANDAPTGGTTAERASDDAAGGGAA